MKIAVFHNIGAGGAKRQLYEQAKGLAERGHTLDLFTTGSGDDREEYLPLAPLCHTARSYSGALANVPLNPGTALPESRLKEMLRGRAKKSPVVRAAIDAVWSRRMARDFAALSLAHAEIARDIDAGGYDAAYICQCRKMLAPDILSLITRTPALFCCNDTPRAAYEWAVVTESGYDKTSESPFRRKSRGRFVSPAVLRFDAREKRRFVANTRAADIVLANSWYTRDRLLCVAGVDGRVVYPGVDSSFFCPNPSVPRDRRLVVSVGALTGTKRHEAVLRAAAASGLTPLPRVEIYGYEARFGSGGLGPEARRLCSLGVDLGVDVCIRQDVTDETIRDAYRRAGAVAFVPYLEPLGLVPLEAMACGAAVVGAAEAGIRETIRDGETGLLASLHPSEMGAAIALVLGDTDLAERLGDRGREVVAARWTWERSVEGVEQALNDTIKLGRGMR